MTPNSSIAINESDDQKLKTAIGALYLKCNARAVVLVDNAGYLVEAAGKLSGIDVTSLASLIAGNAAATSGLASLLGGKKEFNIAYNEGDDDSLFLTTLGRDLILVVLFSGETASLKQIRHNINEVRHELIFWAENEITTARKTNTEPPLTKITDEDIEELFSLE